MTRQPEYFQSDRVSSEYESMLDKAEAQGLKDGASGRKCQAKAYGFYGLGVTLYGKAYRLGKSLAAA